jgi:hypothetical protein
MPTQLEVYNLALYHLKETKLAAIDEARESRYVLDDWWDQTLQFQMEAGFWKFAIRSVSITADPDTATSFGYTHVFNKPSDWVRTYLLSASEYFDPPLEDWVEEGNAFLSDVTPIYLRYVSNSDDGYGYDLDRWTARFTQAMASRLALNCAGKITGSSDSFIKDLTDRADMDLAKALSFEAMRDPNRRPPQGRWNSARNGRSGRRADYWRFAP